MANQGLINVAESGVVLREESKGFGYVPGGVTNFHYEGKIGEAFQQCHEICRSFWCAMKCERELQQHSPELAGSAKRFESVAHQFFVFFGSGHFVSESLPKFCGENEIPVRGYIAEPLLCVFGFYRVVEGSIYFDGVEEFREITRLVKALWFFLWVDKPVPVRIGPACRTDADFGGQFCWGLFVHFLRHLIFGAFAE